MLNLALWRRLSGGTIVMVLLVIAILVLMAMGIRHMSGYLPVAFEEREHIRQGFAEPAREYERDQQAIRSEEVAKTAR